MVDPVSKRPDIKAAVVAVVPHDADWFGFAVSTATMALACPRWTCSTAVDGPFCAAERVWGSREFRPWPDRSCIWASQGVPEATHVVRRPCLHATGIPLPAAVASVVPAQPVWLAVLHPHHPADAEPRSGNGRPTRQASPVLPQVSARGRPAAGSVHLARPHGRRGRVRISPCRGCHPAQHEGRPRRPALCLCRAAVADAASEGGGRDPRPPPPRFAQAGTDATRREMRRWWQSRGCPREAAGPHPCHDRGRDTKPAPEATRQDRHACSDDGAPLRRRRRADMGRSRVVMSKRVGAGCRIEQAPAGKGHRRARSIHHHRRHEPGRAARAAHDARSAGAGVSGSAITACPCAIMPLPLQDDPANHTNSQWASDGHPDAMLFA